MANEELRKRIAASPRVLVELCHRTVDGKPRLGVFVDRQLYDEIEFETEEERQAASDDLLKMLRERGAQDRTGAQIKQ